MYWLILMDKLSVYGLAVIVSVSIWLIFTIVIDGNLYPNNSVNFAKIMENEVKNDFNKYSIPYQKIQYDWDNDSILVTMECEDADTYAAQIKDIHIKRISIVCDLI